MKDAPPHQARAAGIQADPTLQPDRPVNPITATLAALFGVVVLTMVIYGLNASSDRPAAVASNVTPAQDAAASGNNADQNKPQTGQAKQQAPGTTLQGSGNASNPPGATKAQPQSTTASQAPAREAPARQPAGDAPNAAAPAKPDG